MIIKLKRVPIIALVLATMLFIGNCNSKINPKLLSGKWTNKALRRPVYLSIEDDSSYILTMLAGKFEFPGTYKIEKNNINLVDTYCGTKLPGVYEIKVKNGKLFFTLISDNYCERRKILPGEWERFQSENDESQDTTENYEIDSIIGSIDSIKN